MNCIDARGRLDRYLDGELEMDENVQVVRHLESCAGCSSIFEGERMLFDEVRRHAEGAPAPAGLRERIAAEIGRTRPAARPWPFSRALIPAAAAAILVGLFVLVFAPGPLGPEAFAQKAVEWHDGKSASGVPFSSAPELVSFFGSKGRKSCVHEKLVNAGMNYGYKSACVESSGPAGDVTCWWTAGCPASGMRMSHASFAAPPGFEKVLASGQPRRLQIGGRAVIMNHHSGFV